MKYIFKVEGMSCSHCEHAVHEAVKPIAGVTSVNASASKKTVIVKGTGVDTSTVSAAITEAGYEVKGVEESTTDDEDGSRARLTAAQFAIVLLSAAAVLVLVKFTVGFSFIPEIPPQATYGFLFAAGLLTSLHCIAMCGGINISQCVTADCDSNRFTKILPSFLYNSGRVISYTIIGGIIGAAGSVFNFSLAAKSGIMIGAGVFMALLGLQMLGIFSFTKYLPFRIPRFLTKAKLKGSVKYGPFIVGVLNGFMPCGPLQTMQLFAFGTGSAVSGALSMFFFSLGTVPLMFGLGAAGTFLSRRFTMTMYKAGGLLVIVLGIMMAMNGFNLSGKELIAKSRSGADVATVSSGVQNVTSAVTANGYAPVIVQKGIPVRLNFKARAQDLNGCNNAIVIPEFNIEKKLQPGDNIVTFTPQKSGTVVFTCWMGMISSTISVVDDLSKADPAAAVTMPAGNGGGCCGRRFAQ